LIYNPLNVNKEGCLTAAFFIDRIFYPDYTYWLPDSYPMASDWLPGFRVAAPEIRVANPKELAWQRPGIGYNPGRTPKKPAFTLGLLPVLPYLCRPKSVFADFLS